MKKKLTVKEMKCDDIQALQNELRYYAFYVRNNEIGTDFLNAIIALDIENYLYKFLRDKIENFTKVCSLRFSIPEAAVIIKCCLHKRIERNEFDNNIMLKVSTQLDQQLKSQY